jgi:ABC-type enterochelin transport system permease subunit
MSIKENLFVSFFSVVVLLCAVLVMRFAFPIDAEQNLLWLILIVLVLSTLSRSLARKLYKKLFPDESNS